MEKNKMKILKPFFAFVTVWHDKEDPYNVSDYHFYVVAENEKRTKDLIISKIKTFRYHKHNIVIEEMKLDSEHEREICWHGLDSLLIQEQVKMDVEKVKESISEDYSTSRRMRIKELFLNPKDLYNFFILNLCADSKIFIHQGELHIYNKNDRQPFFNEHFEREEKYRNRKMKEFFEHWHKKLDILERDLEEAH